MLGTVKRDQVGCGLHIAGEFHLCWWGNRQRYLSSKFITYNII